MTLNPFFLHGNRSEQGLVQDLVNELIRMAGVDVIYMPRKIINEKKIIKEILVSKFDYGFTLEAYVSNFDGFGGQGDILTKFGVKSTDEITLVVSKERYETLITPFLMNDPSVKLSTRPQEGDLIYFPVDNALFEIKYVEVKKPFYQLNNLYSYQLSCELFEYEDEHIDTGLDNVDMSVKDFGYMQTLYLTPKDSSEAQLSASVLSTFLKSMYEIEVINKGTGYDQNSTIEIDNPPGGGVKAEAQIVLKNSTIDKVLIINPGLGYTVAPKVRIKSKCGTRFVGQSKIASGVLSPIQINSQGLGYISIPEITFSPQISTTSPKAYPILDSSGKISQIYYENCGYGYTTTPSINVENTLGISSGTYSFNEMVVGSESDTRGYIKDWNSTTSTLKVSIVDGSFTKGELIIGDNGGQHTLFSIVTDDLYDPRASNLDIEDEAKDIIDFSEKNPFGDF
jgi:hypothetical protein